MKVRMETDGGYKRYQNACADWQYEQRMIAEKENAALKAEVGDLRGKLELCDKWWHEAQTRADSYERALREIVNLPAACMGGCGTDAMKIARAALDGGGK